MSAGGRGRLGAATIGTALALVVAGQGAALAVARPEVAAPGPNLSGAVAVTGAVANPATYTPAQLSALPATTASGPRGSATGVSLEDLVTRAAPVLPTGKNAQLRVTVTVTGGSGRTTLALGELDPSFGDNPALLVTGRGGEDLVVPGDVFAVRSVTDVRSVSVAVAAPPVPAVAAGSVLVTDGRRQVIVTASRLAGLPQRSLTVSYLAGTTTQTHTERGPDLAELLIDTGVRFGTSVAGVGRDGYVAVVTPQDVLSGRTPRRLDGRGRRAPGPAPPRRGR